MSGHDNQLDEISQAVALQRKKGDALRRRGRGAEASAAYEVALAHVNRALVSKAAQDFGAADIAELLGVRGGLLRRLGRNDEALESYRRGGQVETDALLTTTYNRSNAIKLALITGQSTLDSLEGDIRMLGDAIESTIRSDVHAASDAWTYADLGDAMLLVGRTADSADAYREFAARARTDSPTTTLAVLREIASALKANGDPGSARLAADLNQVEGLLGSRLR